YIIELFSLGPLVLLLFGALFLGWKPTRPAAFLTYAKLEALSPFLVLCSTRPERLLQRRPHRPDQPVRLAPPIVAVAAIYMLGNAVLQKVVLLPRLENTPQARYGLVFAQLDGQGLRRIRTLDGGVDNDDGLIDYTPQRDFYSLVWRARGLDIRADDPNQPIVTAPGEVLVTCDPRYLGWVAGRGPSLTRVAD